MEVYDERKMIDDLYDRCCCECGDYFSGTFEDDYCPECFELLPDEVFEESED